MRGEHKGKYRLRKKQLKQLISEIKNIFGIKKCLASESELVLVLSVSELSCTFSKLFWTYSSNLFAFACHVHSYFFLLTWECNVYIEMNCFFNAAMNSSGICSKQMQSDLHNCRVVMLRPCTKKQLLHLVYVIPTSDWFCQKKY